MRTVRSAPAARAAAATRPEHGGLLPLLAALWAAFALATLAGRLAAG
jgi:hypothetical protein